MPHLLIDVEVVFGGCSQSDRPIGYDIGTIHNSILLTSSRTCSIQIFLILAHLHKFPLSFILGDFLRSERHLLKLFLLFDSTLIFLGISIVFLIDLSSKFLPVTALHVVESALFCLEPLLIFSFTFLNAMLDELLFEIVPFIVESDVVLGDVILVVEQHLVVLSYSGVTFL